MPKKAKTEDFKNPPPKNPNAKFWLNLGAGTVWQDIMKYKWSPDWELVTFLFHKNRSFDHLVELIQSYKMLNEEDVHECLDYLEEMKAVVLKDEKYCLNPLVKTQIGEIRTKWTTEFEAWECQMRVLDQHWTFWEKILNGETPEQCPYPGCNAKAIIAGHTDIPYRSTIRCTKNHVGELNYDWREIKWQKPEIPEEDLNEPHPLTGELAKEYLKLVKGKGCRVYGCDGKMEDGTVMHYNHPGGEEVKGFNKPQWIYITCPKCDAGYSLNQLGSLPMRSGAK